MGKFAAVTLLAACLVAPVIESARAASLESMPGAFWTGAAAGENEERAFGDLLIPVAADRYGLWLLNTRYSFDDDSEEEFNLGIVRRFFLPERDLILGVNLYYDSRWTRHDNHFNQLGFGLEWLSRFVDARANYYLPEHKEELVDSFTQTDEQKESRSWWSDPYARDHRIRQRQTIETRTTRTTYLFERHEQAREGYDMEIGLCLPCPAHLPETRIFAGWYHWDAEYTGDDDIEGLKSRLEIRALPVVFLDASWFEDKELNGSHWLFGARLRLPFDAGNLAHGRNPFAGAFSASRRPTQFRERLLEMVMRDPKLRMEDSGYRENRAARKVETSVSRSRKYYTLLDDVTFVDGDNNSTEDGTAEHPYNTIQEGNDHAFGGRNVYVFAAAQVYDGNVRASAGTTIIGEGHPIRGHGGKYFGGRHRPVVTGNGTGPAIILADGCTLEGFRITNPGTTQGNDPVFGLPGYMGVGVYAAYPTNIYVADNIFENCSHGMMLVSDGFEDFYPSVWDNTFRNNRGVGLWIRGRTSSGDMLLDLYGNQYAHNGSDGLRVRGEGTTFGVYNLENESARDNAGHGISLEMPSSMIADIHMRDISASGNGSNGVYVSQNSWASSFVGSDIFCRSNVADGLSLDSQGFIRNEAIISGMTARDNGGDGLSLNVLSLLGYAFISVGTPEDAAATLSGDLMGGGLGGPRTMESRLCSMPAGTTVLSGNGGYGAYLETMGGFLSGTFVLHTRTDDNPQGGIYAASMVVFNNSWLGLCDVSAGNSLNGPGVSLATHSESNSIVGISRVRTTGNGAAGMNISAAAGETARVYGEHSVSANNTLDGIRLLTPNTPHVSLDFGMGPEGSAGRNSVYGNGTLGINNISTAGTAYVEYNYWGGAAPVAGTDYSGAFDPGTHWLSSDPN